MAICDYPAGSGRRKNGRPGLSANRHGFVLLIKNGKYVYHIKSESDCKSKNNLIYLIYWSF